MKRILILAAFASFSALLASHVIAEARTPTLYDPVPAAMLEQAVRGAQEQLDNPPPLRPEFSSESSNNACVGAIPLLEFYSPGWDVNHMARIMHRESRCDPMALYPNRNVSTATGLLQLLSRTHCPWISDHFGVRCTESWLQDPHNNVMAAAELYRRAGGTNPWATTR